MKATALLAVLLAAGIVALAPRWRREPAPPYRCGSGSADGRVLALLDDTNRFGDRFLESFDLEEAEREFRLTLELAVKAAVYVDVSAREERAQAGLDRIAALLEDR